MRHDPKREIHTHPKRAIGVLFVNLIKVVLVGAAVTFVRMCFAGECGGSQTWLYIAWVAAIALIVWAYVAVVFRRPKS